MCEHHHRMGWGLGLIQKGKKGKVQLHTSPGLSLLLTAHSSRLFLRRGPTMKSWPSWSSLCRPAGLELRGLPDAASSEAGIKRVLLNLSATRLPPWGLHPILDHEPQSPLLSRLLN